MKRFTGRVLCALAAMTIALAALQIAQAQPDEGKDDGGRRPGAGRRGGPDGPGGRGFGGGMPFSSIRLATLDEVATELKLTDDQKKKIEDIGQQLRDDVRASFEDGGGMEKMQELYEAASNKLNEVLDEDQQKRLVGIAIQVNGAGATVEPAVAKALDITDEQKAKLKDARESNMEMMRDAFGEFRDLSPEERRPKFEKLRADANERLLAVLTDEQKEKLESLKGEPIKIDMEQLRGRGGRGFGGRGGGDRDRDRDRDRDNDSDESKSSDDSSSK